MWSEVEPDARAGEGLLAPGARLELGTEAIEMRFVAHDAAERIARDELLEGDEVSRIPPFPVNREHAARLRRQVHQLPRFRERRRERLIDDHVAAGSAVGPGDETVRRPAGRPRPVLSPIP